MRFTLFLIKKNYNVQKENEYVTIDYAQEHEILKADRPRINFQIVSQIFFYIIYYNTFRCAKYLRFCMTEIFNRKTKTYTAQLISSSKKYMSS